MGIYCLDKLISRWLSDKIRRMKRILKESIKKNFFKRKTSKIGDLVQENMPKRFFFFHIRIIHF